MNQRRDRPGRTGARFLWLAAVAGLAAQGCTDSRNWQFHLVPENGKAKVDTDGVTLIFEGVAYDHPPGGRTGGAKGSFTVGGTGAVAMKVTVDGKTFGQSYREGVNTVTFGKYELRILDGGRRLEVGDEGFDLTGTKKTILIHEDGSASVRADGARGAEPGK